MLSILLPYLVAITLLTITPGLDTTLILRTAALESKGDALKAAMGINLGCMVWGLLVAVGLGAILASSALAFVVLKYLGAAYLAWLGLQCILKPRHHLRGDQPVTHQENWWLKGFYTNILNPKVGLFYLSFLPQFIPAQHAVFMWTMGLVFIHIVLSIIWAFCLIALTQPLAQYLKQSAVIRRLDRISGVIFIGFALKLIGTKLNP
ncbi:LysE family translocator [Acinetobacter larvae]|uniref:Threonine transporter RhtB n=1 Tax=Acinetobacter larvae TaxID=1789224 RepID=A0A1B2M164_9GAMM|nr:LysE family translocator [Acinetobacter larvae]AOA58937.1 threonine transporter RhtB [Acinetobacter larvae]